MPCMEKFQRSGGGAGRRGYIATEFDFEDKVRSHVSSIRSRKDFLAMCILVFHALLGPVPDGSMDELVAAVRQDVMRV